MPARVRALGVDGIGHHMDGGFHQGFLLRQQRLGFQRGGSTCRYRLDEALRRGIDHALLEEHQHSQQLLAAIAQRERQHCHRCQAWIQPQCPQLLRLQMAGDGAHRLSGALQQLRHCLRLQQGQFRGVLGPAPFQIQCGGAQGFAAVVHQIQDAAACRSDVHQFVQQPRPHGREIRFGRDATVDLQEAPHRIAHQVKRRAQFIDLAHLRTHYGVVTEIKPSNRLGFACQLHQRRHDPP